MHTTHEPLVGHEDPPWTEPDKAVVVAVDGSRRNRAALEWATATAVGSGRPLILLHVLDESETATPFHPMDTDDELGRRLLSRVTTGILQEHPDAQLGTEVTIGRVADALVARSSGQSTLVVGRRGHGSFLRQLIGSTSIKVTSRARVPVIVVPQHWSTGQHLREPVVVGVDHRDLQHEALLYAFLEARRRGVTLIAAHGREVPARDWAHGSPPEPVPGRQPIMPHQRRSLAQSRRYASGSATCPSNSSMAPNTH